MVIRDPRDTGTEVLTATTMMGRISIDFLPSSPTTTHGFSLMACMPRMPEPGRLRMGVPNREPKTPPLEMVKVPPVMSSRPSLLSRACERDKKGGKLRQAECSFVSYTNSMYACKGISAATATPLTFLPRRAISFSMSRMLMLSALRTTGVTRPLSVETATERST